MVPDVKNVNCPASEISEDLYLGGSSTITAARSMQFVHASGGLTFKITSTSVCIARPMNQHQLVSTALFFETHLPISWIYHVGQKTTWKFLYNPEIWQ